MLSQTSQLEELRSENVDLKKALNFVRSALETKKSIDLSLLLTLSFIMLLKSLLTFLAELDVLKDTHQITLDNYDKLKHKFTQIEREVNDIKNKKLSQDKLMNDNLNNMHIALIDKQ